MLILRVLGGLTAFGLLVEFSPRLNYPYDGFLVIFYAVALVLILRPRRSAGGVGEVRGVVGSTVPGAGGGKPGD